MMRVGAKLSRTGSALALAALLLGSAADAATVLAKKRGAKTTPLASSLGSFTPAAADPRAAASFTRGGLGASGFRFTPSGSRKRGVTVAVRARQTTPAAAQRTAAAAAPTALLPTAYNLGVSVGWKRFALSGDIAKVDTGVLPGGRESADVALSYAGRSWSTRLAVNADRSIGEIPRVVPRDESYSLDLAGSYSLTRNLDVTGGVRYKMQFDRLGPLADDRRDSQAVYVGTAFRF